MKDGIRFLSYVSNSFKLLCFFVLNVRYRVAEDKPEKPDHESHVEKNGFFKKAVAAISHQSREKFAKYPEAVFAHENEKILANIERNKQ